jgi:hypothetical protein
LLGSFSPKKQIRSSSEKETLITKGDFYDLKNKAEDELETENYLKKTVEEVYTGAT